MGLVDTSKLMESFQVTQLSEYFSPAILGRTNDCSDAHTTSMPSSKGR